MKRNIIILTLVCIGTVASSAVAAQTLRWLGVDLGGRTHDRSEAKDVSNDGIVVGYFSRANGGSSRAFVWDATRNLQPIPLSANASENAAWGISSDGRWIVGWEAVGFEVHGYRWPVGNLTGGQRFGNSHTYPRSISDDGTVTVGMAFNLSYYMSGFVWNGQSLSPLPPIPGGNSSFALAINSSGTRAVGASNVDGYNVATLWEIDSGIVVNLGGFRSQANSLSDDASVIVGTNNFAPTYGRACRWVNRQGPISIHTFSGVGSTAYDVSGDGRIIVGRGANGGTTDSAFMWTEREGMVDLNIRFANLLPPGSRLIQANAISKNGRYIVGYGRHLGKEQAFVLELPCFQRSGDADNNGCVDDVDLLRTLFDFGASGTNPTDFNCDNIVDDADLLTVLFNFGQGC